MKSLYLSETDAPEIKEPITQLPADSKIDDEDDDDEDDVDENDEDDEDDEN